MSRLIVISNRVAPMTEGQGTAGGLAVGVFDALRETGGVWFGWSGEVTTQSATTVSSEPAIVSKGNITYATVGLSRRDYDQYYRGFANATLWPIFHYRVDLARFQRQEYHGYRRVNSQFAHQLKVLVEPDDILWVHDYHLIPFAAECRALGLTNRIGFFLHIPFPAPEILTTIPPHEELMRALCAYDLLGFQTETDRVAFYDYIEREARGYIENKEQNGPVHAFGHTLRAEVYPIGVHPDEIAQQAVSSLARRNPLSPFMRRTNPRGEHNGSQPKLIMSVDRLDYSKGLPERFHAFEQLLDDFPDHRRHVTFIQIAPTSRQDVQSYQQIRQRLEAESGRINGKHSELDWTPIRYINKQYERRVLMALFRTSHVGYVTPLRDGMNLVAKEYVAAQDPEDPGVLVLSRFAGAARELDAALIVNPYDTRGMAEALNRALTMPLEERKARYAHMMDRLRTANLTVWRERFVADLRNVARDVHVAPHGAVTQI
ncbi:alpha,alpha-trehalose-phosphate synthase (UDP-forming) [Ralstonia insidiosa]|uniref:Trehalose-6-phosphate synthase n=1 Tax=Ralstonia insidiosa TaxID=190721 RepID=A0A848NY57_9RALS|nr:alpha,alpha-trehalose-phosphate synthase (UDP-forming) [Ralstonia insidiosa]NMV39992.1 alpha,alpha-trehalose-phosphate synthase (UDP-forming) [Ralstonia insidiosa]